MTKCHDGDAGNQLGLDYACTIYEKRGIDRSKPIYTPSNRSVYFGHLGKPFPGVV